MPFAVAFVNLKMPQKGTLLLAVKKGRDLGALGRDLDKKTGGALARAMKTSKFEGGAGSTMELLAPAGTGLDRVVLIGLGDPAKLTAIDLEKLGGTALGTVEKASGTLTLVLEHLPDAPFKAGEIAARAGIGMVLRAYAFDRYRTKNKPAKKCYHHNKGNAFFLKGQFSHDMRFML